MLTDENARAEFIGSLATDVVKTGIASIITFVAGCIVVTPFIAFNVAIVVGVVFFAAWGLNNLDEKFGVTDKVVEYIDASQQEVAQKAREMEGFFWDLGAMFAGKMLVGGWQVIESEIRTYLQDTVRDVIPRIY